MANNILAVTNRKGGVGKTTLSVNLAAGLAINHNLECVLIDADPIGSTSLWMEKSKIKRLKSKETDSCLTHLVTFITHCILGELLFQIWL